MSKVVLDASVVLSWFDEREGADSRASGLLDRFESGSLRVVAPRLLPFEVLNVVGRKWRWSPEPLVALAATIDGMDFELVDPELVYVATWMNHGLSAYDASYVAVAAERGLKLVTADAAILEAAPEIAVPLGAV